ncbi:MAG TPA: STAS domain-containing protein [bacterium]|nr:STAS domain-containing protein [bacterium]
MDIMRRESVSDTLRVARRQVDGALILSVAGEVDLANVASLASYLTAAAGAAERLVIDLRDLRYIDSCGIKALLDARRFYARGGRAIVLAALTPSVRRTFEVLQVEQVVPVFPTVEAAVESFNGGKKT